MAEEIFNLIREGEHQQLDFKYRIDDSAKIARTLVAFANTDGGRLLVGVKDNGKLVGVKSDEDFYVVEAAAEIYSRPAIGFEMRSWNVEGKKVLEFYVPPSSRKPHRCKNDEGEWKAFMRRDDKNQLANGVILKVWELGLLKRPPNWIYSKAEQSLFSMLEENGEISLSAFTRTAKVRRNKAENTLARLISWGIIEMVFSENGCRYRLTPQFKKELH